MSLELITGKVNTRNWSVMYFCLACTLMLSGLKLQPLYLPINLRTCSMGQFFLKHSLPRITPEAAII